jgi:dihydrofolate reductase
VARLGVFNSVSLDGYFTDDKNDMSWAHQDPNDAEWNEFVSGNASGGGALLLGRVTYDMMAGFWPTSQAKEMMPEVAEGMNRMKKFVASHTLKSLSWANTTVVKGDLASEVRKLKKESGQDMVILGSGTIVSQLTQAHLIDEYQMVVVPIVLGKGRTMFEGVKDRPTLKQTKSRTFKNGNVVLTYEAER